MKSPCSLQRNPYRISKASFKPILPEVISRPIYKLTAGQHHLTVGARTLIMGIMNMTPDSFSQDGLLKNKSDISHHALSVAQKLIREDVDMIDIGGESTRPGSHRITIKEECARIIPTITTLAKKIKVPISVDTYKPMVAQRALDAGAVIVNNIMGANPDRRLLEMVRNYKAAIVLMHMRGNPQTMQKRIHYKNLIAEIKNSLRNSLEKCLEIGIKSDRIIIDPGIGFGKTVEHNLEIINRLNEFKDLKAPLLIGVSRKSFIGKILNKDVSDRLLGTIASVVASILRGAHIVRLHDVKAAKEAITITDAILNQNTP